MRQQDSENIPDSDSTKGGDICFQTAEKKGNITL
jgi:hypothetical protein